MYILRNLAPLVLQATIDGTDAGLVSLYYRSVEPVSSSAAAAIGIMPHASCRVMQTRDHAMARRRAFTQRKETKASRSETSAKNSQAIMIA